jgi:hypothetical protein
MPRARPAGRQGSAPAHLAASKGHALLLKHALLALHLAAASALQGSSRGRGQLSGFCQHAHMRSTIDHQPASTAGGITVAQEHRSTGAQEHRSTS